MEQRVGGVVLLAPERMLFDALIEPHSGSVIDAAPDFRRELLLRDGGSGWKLHRAPACADEVAALEGRVARPRPIDVPVRIASP